MSEERKRMYCPLMKEMCINGHTKSMGQDQKTGEQPKCRFWIGLAGEANGKPVDDYDCAIAWQPTLMVEQARVQNGTAAAMESVRNHVSKATDALKLIANTPPSMPNAIDTTAVAPDVIEHKPKKKRKKKNK